MDSWASQNFADCQLGDKRLNQRALEIGRALVVGFGQALSMIFKEENPLKRAYEFLANPKEKKPFLGCCLPTESVTTAAEAATILRWYTYRWHVEEYHLILKSGCKA